jgi:hypothetical protein
LGLDFGGGVVAGIGNGFEQCFVQAEGGETHFSLSQFGACTPKIGTQWDTR